jgi:hypothetical protein
MKQFLIIVKLELKIDHTESDSASLKYNTIRQLSGPPISFFKKNLWGLPRPYLKPFFIKERVIFMKEPSVLCFPKF